MNQRNPSSSSDKLAMAALLVAAAGFVIQIVSGVDVPTVPPSLVILLVAASLVALLPWRWVPVVGAWVQFLTVVVTVVAGTAATIQNYRTRL